MTDRHLALEGCFNFRDLGGYRGLDGRTVRWERLYRADALSRLTEADLAALGERGIRTVVDLRSSLEVDQRGRFPESLFEVDYHHLPMFDVVVDDKGILDAPWDDPTFIAERYRGMLTSAGHAIAGALQALARPGALPAVFHCTAGKDRTGLVSALTLGLLGVSDDDVAADYGLSAAAMERAMDWYLTEFPVRQEELQRASAAMVAAFPETMRQVLDWLREEHGGVAGYVASIGAGDVVQPLRDALLE